MSTEWDTILDSEPDTDKVDSQNTDNTGNRSNTEIKSEIGGSMLVIQF